MGRSSGNGSRIAAQRDSFLRIVEASSSISRHEDLYSWLLQGEIQLFIPHEMLISAYGYFDTWQLKLHVISSLPGVPNVLTQCEIDGMLQKLFKRWVEGGRRPFVLHSPQGLGLEHADCHCPLHSTLRNMKSLLVHGVRDERGECDCLYLALNSAPVAEASFSDCLRQPDCFIVDALISQIDVASRKLASLPGAATTPAASRNGGPFSLTAREQEILEWICKGKTNWEIGIILDISCFTVKNHVQHIFQKIGASNRVQAVTIFKEKFSPKVLQMLQPERLMRVNKNPAEAACA